MKAWIEAPVPDQLNPVLTLEIFGNGTLLTKSPGQLTSLELMRGMLYIAARWPCQTKC